MSIWKKKKMQSLLSLCALAMILGVGVGCLNQSKCHNWSLPFIVYDLLSRMAMKGFDENKNNALDSDERTQFIYYLKVINYNL